jgi:hypothetical protein
MKLCIEGDIYFIPKFYILKTGMVKLSIETGLSLILSNPRNHLYNPGEVEGRPKGGKVS